MTLDNSTTYLFAKVANAFRDRLDKGLNEIGLYGGQTFVLICLWEKDGLSQIELSQKLNLSPPTISAMVKSLGRNGFVKNLKCERDGRAVRVYVSEKGLACRELVESKWNERENNLLSGLNETEKLIFRQIIEKLKESLLPGTSAN